MSTASLKSRSPIVLAVLLPLVWVLSSCTSQPGVEQALSQTSAKTSQKTAAKRTAQKAKSKPRAQAQALAPSKPEKPAPSEQQIAAATGNSPASAKVEISFLPLKGMPQTAQTKLSKKLYGSAGKYDVDLLTQNQPRGDLGLTGYFTALNDGSGTLLIYVWDIVDKNGNRLHRINGQERSGATSPDPWRSIDEEQFANVADRTMQSVQTWIAGRNS